MLVAINAGEMILFKVLRIIFKIRVRPILEKTRLNLPVESKSKLFLHAHLDRQSL
jgi:hypothetical protein